MKSYYFTEEHNLFRQSLRDFLNKEVIPNIDQWEEDRRIPKDFWKKFGEMGYFGLNFPEKYGGSDLDFFYSVILVEEISKCFSGGFAIMPMVQSYMSTPYILTHGSDYLKDKYLPKAIAGELICSIAISEPGAGSDAMNIQTKAIRDGDHYIVNGSKTFITNGVYGDFMVTVVKTDPDAGVSGVSLLVIDRDAEGVSARKLKKLGWHASDTAELNFDDVKVPVKNLIGDEGMGFYYLMGGLQLERLIGAVSSIGSCDASLKYALQYMSERKAFGRPINKFQVLRHRVAQMASEMESNRYFTYHCCRLHNDGEYAVKESSMAKLLGTELCNKVATECLQFFGGYGYMEDYKMARVFRDARIGTIGAGTSEVMREIISKMIIDGQEYEGS
jgi:alkylation response protein AidB-like acyl-CoA dehydrogenase